MKKIDLGRVIATLANVGVIAGIFFLAIEIQQNNKLLEAQAIATALETRVERQVILLNNPHLIDTFVKNFNGEPLTDEEVLTIVVEYSRALLGWQKDFFLFLSSESL